MSTPAERVTAAVDEWGAAEVVTRCAVLLRLPPSEVPTGDALDLAVVLGGLRDGGRFLATGKGPGGNRYWARVWAARALRYEWAEPAAPAVVAGLGDEQWRVREMCAKVVADRELGEAADRELGEAADRLVELLGVDVPRVRAAAVRALGVVGESEHGDAVRAAVDDPENAVAAAAESALRTLERRLDRRF